MKHRPQQISTRSRIVLIAILAIVVPTIILSLFGLQLITELQRRRDDELPQRLRLTAESTAKEIVELGDEYEKKLNLAELPGDVEALKARLEEIEKDSGLVEHAFLIDSSDQLLYPVLELPAEEPPRPRLLREEELLLQSLIRKANQQEYVLKDREAALEHYIEHRNQVLQFHGEGKVGSFEVAKAVHEVASCRLLMGDHTGAITDFSQLAYSPEFERAAFRLSLLAKYQIAGALEGAGDRQQSIRASLELYGYLIKTKPQAGQGPLMELFRQRILERLDDFRAEGWTDEHNELYEKLRDADQRRKQHGQFLQDARRWWQYRRPQYREETTSPRHVRHDLLESGLVYFVIIELQHDNFALAGFKIDFSYMLEEIVEPTLQRAPFGTAVNKCIVDSNDRVVYGVASGKSDGAIEIRLPRQYNFWKLQVLDEDPYSARRLARNLTIVYVSLNLIVLGLIFAGIWLTLKQMNRELEVTRMKSDFVSNVSHELKTPLALIRMFSETLQLGRVREERKQEYYEVISKESERLTALINNVLDFSKIDAGRRTYNLQPASIAQVVENTLGAYRFELSRENFEVEVGIEANLPEIAIDHDAILQALLNLLNNAVKYSRERKEIKIRVYRQDAMVCVAVSDRGIGIGKEEQRKIFDMFYRGSDESVRTTRGTGLGLAITKHAAEAHGGRLTVESVKGEGSTFTIMLPVDEAGDEATRAESVQPAST